MTELIRRGLRVATAESLTAGLLAATIAVAPLSAEPLKPAVTNGVTPSSTGEPPPP